MSRHWRIRIEDALQAIDEMENFVDGMNYEEFVKNLPIKRAVERNIEILGEALKHIPERVQNSYPNVSWRKIIGMRNVLSHEYFDVVVEISWAVVTTELGMLKGELEEMLEKENDEF